MKALIYLKSNMSGIGDRLVDLMMIYTYSKYLNCDKVYLHWEERQSKGFMINDHSLHGRLRKNKTPFRKVDFLLENLLKFMVLPDDIVFVTEKDLLKVQNKRDEFSNINHVHLFKDYLGSQYSLHQFMDRYKIKDKDNFEKDFYDNFKKIGFKNIPQSLKSYFIDENTKSKNRDHKSDNFTLGVHLRRGDKVCNDGGMAFGVQLNELEELDKLTYKFIDEQVKNWTKSIYDVNNATSKFKIFIVSDEKKVRDEYVKILKEKYSNQKDSIEIITFDGDTVSQTYYDIYVLSNCQTILMSQKFSVFTIMSSMINGSHLYYPISNEKMNLSSKCKNISLWKQP